MPRKPKADPYTLPLDASVKRLEIDAEAFKKTVLVMRTRSMIFVEAKKIQSCMQGCHFPLHPLLMPYWRGYGGERRQYFIPNQGVFFFYEINLVIGWIRHLTEKLPMTEAGLDRALIVMERLQYVANRG